MVKAYAAEKACLSTTKGKTFQDRKAHHTNLEPGGRILVRSLSECGGPGKFAGLGHDQPK